MLVSTNFEKNNAVSSSWKPSSKEKEALALILSDWTIGKSIMDKPRNEFNNKNLIDRMNEDQMSFNSYQEEKSNDPNLAWRSRAVRPVVRNKVISIAAHVTQNLIYPNIFAQNDSDEQDKDAAEIMRLLVEYVAEQSDYEKKFLYAVIGALVNPATIIHREYSEVWRKIKKITGKDKWELKEVLDEVYSGYKQSIVPCDEFFIENFYEHDIQKQGFLIWRKPISKYEAEIKYGNSPNFEFVKPGLQTLFDNESGQFYEQQDDDISGELVEEVIYYNRYKDLELVVLNGVLVTNPERPMQREDKLYPFAKTGYELLDEGRCFYYRSLAFKLHNDEEVVNTLYRMLIDSSYLNTVPPAVAYGNDNIDSSIMIPGAITSFSRDTKIEPLLVGNNLTAGYNALSTVESSISESSTNDLQNGGSGGSGTTAFEISRMEQNARVMLGLFGKMIGFLVKDIGTLMIGDILQFATIGDMQELTNGKTMLKFSKYTINNKNVSGKNQDVTVEFDAEMPEEMTPEEEEKKGYDLLKKEGGMDSTKRIKKVNPTLFRNLKYKIKVTPDIVNPPSDSVRRALNIELYDRAIMSPMANQEALYRDLLLGSYDKTNVDVDKYIKQAEKAPAGGDLASLIGASPTAGGPVNAVANAEKMKL